jgi:hypothetical protein
MGSLLDVYAGQVGCGSHNVMARSKAVSVWKIISQSACFNKRLKKKYEWS